MEIFWLDQLERRIGRVIDDELTHLVKVKRHKEGDKILCTTGNGDLIQGVLSSIKRNEAEISIQSIEHQNRRKRYLHIATALTKNMERVEFFLEKAIELGIEEITFLECDHSVRSNLRMERLNRIIRASVKQSLNLYAPKINQLISFDRFIEDMKDSNLKKWIAHCRLTSKERMKLKPEHENPVLVLIGPEGDFSEREVDLAISDQYESLDLGASRLRTETAAIYCTAIFKFINDQ